MAGRKLQPKGGDTSQLGGDFIIDSQGKIQLAYRSHDPADRPPVEDLLEIIEKCGGVEGCGFTKPAHFNTFSVLSRFHLKSTR